MFAEERQRWILGRVQEQGRCRVAELAHHLRRSTVTIRQDLRALEGQGLLHRTHGGAEVPAAGAARAVGLEEERRIARAAAALVRDGDTLLLDAAPATRALARLLRAEERRLVVVTNAIDVATLLEDAASITTLVPGGTLSPGQHALLGPYAAEGLSRLRVDLAFLGASGVDGAGGITAGSAAEAAVKARFLRAGRRRVLLAASSALGRVSPARFGSLGDVDLLITGRAASPAGVAALKALGLEISCA